MRERTAAVPAFLATGGTAVIVGRVRAWIGERANHEPLAVFALSRGFFLLVTYLGIILFNSKLHDPVHPSFLHQLMPAWNQWDERGWYLQIASRGYGWKTIAGTGPAAFFPLYPALVHEVQAITGRSAHLVALGISNVCFLIALFYLWRLVRWELNAEVAGRTILYVATFPTALFFFAGYTESLFLWLSVACFYHFRRRQWLLAGLFGALASATRVTGVLLLVPFLYDYLRSRNFSLRRLDYGALGLVLVPAGLCSFMLYLQVQLGNALSFTQYQAAWQKIFTLRLWAGFLETLREILVVQPPASFFEAHNLINGVLGVLFLVGTVCAARHLPAAYTLYSIPFWLITLSSPAMAGGYEVPLISLSRYVLSLFPTFIYLGIMGKTRVFHDAYLVLSAGLLAVLTVQFINGGWIV